MADPQNPEAGEPLEDPQSLHKRLQRAMGDFSEVSLSDNDLVERVAGLAENARLMLAFGNGLQRRDQTIAVLTRVANRLLDEDEKTSKVSVRLGPTMYRLDQDSVKDAVDEGAIWVERKFQTQP